jgi:hypothetical protein
VKQVLCRGWLLGLVTLVLYALIAPRWIVEGDNAELAGLSALGGAAHPSGYPLYVLWLRIWSWLPASSPAHAAALATCLLTAIEVVLIHAACRAWGARPAAATIAAALVAASPVVMRVQSQAEVFALNGVIAAAILYLARGPLRGEWRVVALALVAGLGISNHVTCVLLAPVGVWGAVRGVRESERAWPVTVAMGIAALAIGLLPYLYLLVAPATACSWGALHGLGDVVHHFLRQDYGGPGELSPHGADVAATENLGALAATLGRAFLWLPAVAALVWVAIAIHRNDERAGWLVWLASFLLAGPVLVGRFNLHPTGLEHYTVSRFHLLPMVLLAVPVAVAIDRLPGTLLANDTAGSLVGIAVFLGAAIATFPSVARYHTACVQRSLENMLDTLPPDAIVIGTEDILHFGGNYVQGVLGERPDATIIVTPQVGLSYYRERIQKKTGVDLSVLVAKKGATPSVRIAELMLATGRPVFIDAFQANIAKSFAIYPYGALYRVLPRGTAVPSISELFEINKALYAKFRFDYPVPARGDDLAGQAHQLYAAPWSAIARATPEGSSEHAYAVQMLSALVP